MADLILHHYPPSPMAEKARLALGFKGQSWRSVEVPRLPPKPDLLPLTGGYRRVPVLQAGADIYCDSQCILNELERRFPEPSFLPGSSAGVASAVARWADGTLFGQAVQIIVATAVGTMPEEWIKDRTQLMFGPGRRVEELLEDLPYLTSQLRAQFGWVERCLQRHAFVLGEEPSLADFALYPIVWVLRARWDGAAEVFFQLDAIEAWEKRVAAIGHGSPSDMESGEAVEAARAAEPQTPEWGEPHEVQDLRPGMRVSVCPSGLGGDPQVEGVIRFVSAETIALLHENDRVGTVCVNFPRVGYRVSPA